MKVLRTFARVDGHLLRVSVEGDGPPILLIMGLGGNIEMWGPLEREFHQRGFQTIAYDASGTGHSPPRLVPLRPHGLARQAAHLLDALGLPDANVLGVSFGGGVAQELALRNPHRVRRLVLASTACGLGGVPGNPIALGLLATPLRYYSPRFLQTTAPWMYGPVADADGGLMRQQINAAPFPPSDAVGLRQPALRVGRLDEPAVAASHRRTDARPHRLEGSDRPTDQRAASSVRGSPEQPSMSCPTRATCC